MSTQSQNKELLFSITEKDFDWSYSRGSGKGGQKRNKTESAVHCRHRESGAIGYSDDTRSQHKNKISAFKRCIRDKKFVAWHKLEVSKKTGELKQIEEKIDFDMKHNIKVEVKEDGKWKEIKSETGYSRVSTNLGKY